MRVPFLVVIAILIQSCSGDDIGAQSSTSKVDGDWLGPCSYFAMRSGQDDGLYTGTFILTFDKGEYYQDIELFFDDECTLPREEFRSIRGIFTLDGVVTTIEGDVVDRLEFVEEHIESNSTFEFPDELRSITQAATIIDGQLILGGIHPETGVAHMFYEIPLTRLE